MLSTTTISLATSSLDANKSSGQTVSLDFEYDGKNQQRLAYAQDGSGNGSRELYCYDSAGARYMDGGIAIARSTLFNGYGQSLPALWDRYTQILYTSASFFQNGKTMLFDKVQLGSTALANRLIMAPLTRCRADAGHVPNALMAEYYSQRASAGLIITECTMVMPNTSTFVSEPGIYSEEQVSGWKQTTEAVHAAGGKIFLQIWHGGRAAHPLMNDGAENVGPSAIAIEGEVHTPKGKAANVKPRELRDDELPGIVAAFKQAALNAIAAGFDGVEVHGANGYLLDQFLRDGSNQRSGAYGGSLENRGRLLFEVLDAVTGAIGAERVGLRLSPLNSYNSMIDSDPLGLVRYLAERLNSYGLAYLHLMRADFFGQQEADVVTPVRELYKGKLMVNMGYSPEEAEQVITDGQADLVAFGTGFLANPDLPARIKAGAAWNEATPKTFYTPGAVGYTDYPSMRHSSPLVDA